MTYVAQSLGRDEKVVGVGKVHWAALITPFVWLMIGFLTVPFGIGAVIVLVAIIALIVRILYMLTTEIAVTNKKVVAKWGVISRHTIEQRLSKVDAVTVNQGLIGRLLNFGSLSVQGSGLASTPIRMIADPLAFRRAVEAAEELSSPTAAEV